MAVQNVEDLFKKNVFEFSYSNIPIPNILDSNTQAYADAAGVNSILYSVMDWKASKSALIKPIVVKTVKDSIAAKEFYKWNGKVLSGYEQTKLNYTRTKAFEEIDMDDIGEKSDIFLLKKLLTRPNDYQRFTDFMYAGSMFKDMGWEALYGTKLNGGLNRERWQEMYTLPTHLLEIIAGGQREDIKGYRFKSKFKDEFPAEEVIRISGFSMNYNSNGGHLYGTNKIKIAWPEIEAYAQSVAREYSSFSNGDLKAILFPKVDNSGGIIGGGFGDTITEQGTYFQKFKDMILRAFKQKGDQKMSIIGQPLDAIQFKSDLQGEVTSRAKREAKEAICAAWKLNAQVVFPTGSGTTYDNQKEYAASCLRSGVFPDLRAKEEALREEIVKKQFPGYSLIFDYDVYEELTRDLGKEIEYLEKATFLSDNEKRAYIDYEELIDPRALIPKAYWDISIPDPLPENGEV